MNPASAQARRLARYAWRRRTNRLALALALAAMGFGMFWLFWILWEALRLGAAGMHWTLLTETTPPPGGGTDAPGGLANAMYGSAIMVLLATCAGTPVGVLAGVHLAEYGPRGGRDALLAAGTRFASDILLSAPSIVLGLFVYAVVVARMRGFSAWAGIAALALIVIPVVVRTTENMLLLVPASLREAAYALGAPQWRVTAQIALRAARAGLVTGVLLAVARIAGETAPLLFTALGNQFFSSSLSQPTASLPVTIFQFAMSPYENWQRLAWAGVLIIIVAVLGLNILARVIARNK